MKKASIFKTKYFFVSLFLVILWSHTACAIRYRIEVDNQREDDIKPVKIIQNYSSADDNSIQMVSEEGFLKKKDKHLFVIDVTGHEYFQLSKKAPFEADGVYFDVGGEAVAIQLILDPEHKHQAVFKPVISSKAETLEKFVTLHERASGSHITYVVTFKQPPAGVMNTAEHVEDKDTILPE